MKKIKYLQLQWVALFLLVLTTSCGEKKQIESARSLNITVDPRIELLAVVQFLSGYGERTGLITRYDFPYKADVSEYFSACKNHPAVKLFEEMSVSGFSFDAPPDAMLHLSDPPELTLQVPYTRNLKRRAGGQERLEKFIQELRDFAQKTNFTSFFEAHKGTYSKLVSDTYGKMQGVDFIATLENYYGMKQLRYNIILAPLFHPGGFGPRIDREGGSNPIFNFIKSLQYLIFNQWSGKSYEIYNICGPTGVENGIPSFGTQEGFRQLAWHEFGHSFVNPLSESLKNRIKISEYSSLFMPIREKMEKEGYSNWETCVNEHIVRAITARLTFIHFGKQAGEDELRDQKSRGFVYIDPLCKKLEEYEIRRDKYPAFADFFQELLKVFEEITKKGADKEFYSFDFVGPINAVISDKESIVLILPTQESDKAVQDEIHKYVMKIYERFFKGCLVLTDAEALSRDLSKNSLIIYGTARGNLWLAQHLNEFPLRIEPDKIVTDSVYYGTDLRFITAWPNPQNPQKGMVIYTAQKAEDIVGINGVFHGGTDYVIAKGTEILKQGNYKKDKGLWLFR
ncbi:MAG: DUF4932 domain-containing protein [candidate division Zixibacteria bacterium]|nr:DUF4932 domain-containing protein [candidate division Zixibacteria bacterium]